MARSLSNAKLLAPSVADGISLAINQLAKGYAAATSSSRGAVLAAAAAGGGGCDKKVSTDRVVEMVEEKDVIREKFGSTTTTWVPDPVTGYYRPSDCAAVIDTVDQREMLRTQTNKTN